MEKLQVRSDLPHAVMQISIEMEAEHGGLGVTSVDAPQSEVTRSASTCSAPSAVLASHDTVYALWVKLAGEYGIS